MKDTVPVKADIPATLKRRVFSELALRDEKFNRWLIRQMELWLEANRCVLTAPGTRPSGDEHDAVV